MEENKNTIIDRMKGKNMSIKRFLSGILLFPIFAVIMIFGNKYVIDICISIIAIMSLHEFYKAFNGKAKPVQWLGYVVAISMAFIHIIPSNLILPILGAIIPACIMILFTEVILSDMKKNIIDIAITFFGICYIAVFLMFVPIIRENMPNGRILIWYVFIGSWGTDIFAYLIGKNFGKHKFTDISPNKSIEGCIGGIVGAMILTIGYTILCNNIWGLEINYLYAGFMGILLSCASQIGDLAASSIKRYCEIKDYSNLIPGHGGMLDRIDSVIFVLPFAYFLLALL